MSEFRFEGVKVGEGVVGRAVVEAEEEGTGSGVYGEPDSFGGGRALEFVGGDGVVASVDGDSSVVHVVACGRESGSVAS